MEVRCEFKPGCQEMGGLGGAKLLEGWKREGCDRAGVGFELTRRRTAKPEPFSWFNIATKPDLEERGQDAEWSHRHEAAIVPKDRINSCSWAEVRIIASRRAS